MKRVYDFLSRLRENNDREWFGKHKAEYLEVQGIFNAFVEKLIPEIARFDPGIDPERLAAKDCTYRIYRDIRFSKDKSPYKTHMGAYICRGGKKSPYAGYYFHVEPPAGGKAAEQISELKEEGNGGNLLACGLYCPDPKVVQSLRDEISVNGGSFLRALEAAKGYTLDTYQVLRRVPRGFEQVREEWKELLRHKDFSISIPLENEVLFSGGLPEYVADTFSRAYEFNRILNLAVDYALEEM